MSSIEVKNKNSKNSSARRPFPPPAVDSDAVQAIVMGFTSYSGCALVNISALDVIVLLLNMCQENVLNCAEPAGSETEFFQVITWIVSFIDELVCTVDGYAIFHPRQSSQGSSLRRPKLMVQPTDSRKRKQSQRMCLLGVW